MPVEVPAYAVLQMCWCLSNCRKTCLTVSTLLKTGLCNTNFHLNPTAVQGPISALDPAALFCVIVLDGQHWNADKRSILMERSAKGTFFPLGLISILWIWTSGLQANKSVFLIPSLTGDGPRKKVGSSLAGTGAGVGVYKEILLQWISVKDWQTGKKSTLSGGKGFSVGSGTW